MNQAILSPYPKLAGDGVRRVSEKNPDHMCPSDITVSRIARIAAPIRRSFEFGWSAVNWCRQLVPSQEAAQLSGQAQEPQVHLRLPQAAHLRQLGSRPSIALSHAVQAYREKPNPQFRQTNLPSSPGTGSMCGEPHIRHTDAISATSLIPARSTR